MGISDIIENFLREMIDSEGSVEIKRNNLANHFGCVPSQINYVIQTRFTNERGYIVESRRGGGGYVKISRVTLPGKNYLMHIVNNIGKSIDFETARIFIENMVAYEHLSVREGKLILNAISDKALAVPSIMQDQLRASILKNMIVGLGV